MQDKKETIIKFIYNNETYKFVAETLEHLISIRLTGENLTNTEIFCDKSLCIFVQNN